MTRRGRESATRFIKSKKWQHFSTRVPPVLRLNRFQLPTFTKNGKRCSRIAIIFTSPIRPDLTCDTRAAMGAMYRYSRPTHVIARRDEAARTMVLQSSMVVHIGFSTSTGKSVAYTSFNTEA